MSGSRVFVERKEFKPRNIFLDLKGAGCKWWHLAAAGAGGEASHVVLKVDLSALHMIGTILSHFTPNVLSCLCLEGSTYESKYDIIGGCSVRRRYVEVSVEARQDNLGVS